MSRPSTDQRRVLISGAGIAGLTLATLLKEQGWSPVVLERDPAMRTEGYMMDFFGTGWDVAERMGLVPALRAIRYPIDAMDHVDRDGRVTLHVPVGRIRDALDDKYVYLRRSDLERILYERAQKTGVEIRFGAQVESMEEGADHVRVTDSAGRSEDVALVFGADGLHSRVRALIFGPEQPFALYLGGYVAAFHITGHAYPIGRALKLHEETDRIAGFYPIDADTMAATFVFRSPDRGHVPRQERLGLLKRTFSGAGWIAGRVLEDFPASQPVYFDSLTQIRMPNWTRGRVALLGDACGCLTLLAGQGSHMAMAGAYVLATELKRHDGDHAAAFAAYESVLKKPVATKQRDAALFAKVFMPTARSRPWLRRLVIKAMFSEPVLKYAFRSFGSRSALRHYR